MRTNLPIRLLCLSAALLLTAAGCKNREPRLVTHTLEVAPAALSFAFDETGIPKRIGVETDAPSFSFSVSYSGQETDWLETAQGETCITVSAASRNVSDSERRATVTVSADRAASRTVVITQGTEGEGERTDYAVVLSPASLELPACGTLTGEAEIISAGSGFRAERAAGDTWYEVRIEKQRLIVTAAPNSSAEVREGAATVTNAEGGEAVLTIRQAGIPSAYGITLEPASLTFASSGDGLNKTVSIVTQGSAPAVSVTPDQAEWLSAEVAEKRLLVTATVNDGGERRGEVTVTNAEGAFAVLEVTQQAAGDTGIAVEPAQLSFGPEGGRRTCGIATGGTGLTAVTDTGSAAWLSAAVTGTTLEVTAAPWSGSGVRSGTVTVRSAEGSEAAVAVSQQGTPIADLSGTWQWHSLSATTDDGTNASELSGTATITRENGGYAVTGIAGSGVQGLGGTTATIHLVLRDGTAGVSFGAAFRKGDKPYYSAPHLVFPSGIVEAWTEPETFLPVAVERDASGLERLLLPDLLTATPELFPDSGQLWGETGEVSYIYYETITMGGIAVPVPTEYHRHVVLTRQQP